MMKMPIDMKTGDYDRLEIDDLREKINLMFQSNFGDQIDLDDDQISGQFAGTWSLVADYLEQLPQGILAGFFLIFAQGYQIDQIANDEGYFRKAASYATVELQIDGYIDPDSPTLIEAPATFSTADGHIFETADDVTISEQATVMVDGVATPLTDEDGNPLGRVTVSANAEESGTDSNVMPGTVVNSEQSIDGFYSVTNPNGATGGGDAETNNEFKLRVMTNRTHSKGANKSAVEMAVKNVDGVKDAKLINNIDLTVDKYGTPPKSVHLYVIGGEDQAVAEAFFTAYHVLLHSNGSIQKTVTDIGGDPTVVKFDHATTVPVYINVDLTIDDATFDVDNGPTTIKQNILQYFDTLLMGTPVLYSRLFGPVYNVSGIKNTVITLGIDKTKLSAGDAKVDEFQLAVTSADNISITIEGA